MKVKWILQTTQKPSQLLFFPFDQSRYSGTQMLLMVGGFQHTAVSKGAMTLLETMMEMSAIATNGGNSTKICQMHEN